MGHSTFSPKLERVDKWRWRIRRQGPMRTEAIIYAASRWVDELGRDGSIGQIANVACLPGIVGPALAMPDIHQGYGFPIGGVAAFDVEEGIVSPGGVGYDINCGVRLVRTCESFLTRRKRRSGNLRSWNAFLQGARWSHQTA